MVAIAFSILAVSPLAIGFLAALAAIVLASRIARACEADTVLAPTPGETAEWIASFDDLDVDAEWIALASVCPDCGESFEVCAATVCGWIGEFSPVKARKDYRPAMHSAVERVKARNEAAILARRAAIEETIAQWLDRADQWEESKPDAFDTLETLERLARYAADRSEETAAGTDLLDRAFALSEAA